MATSPTGCGTACPHVPSGKGAGKGHFQNVMCGPGPRQLNVILSFHFRKDKIETKLAAALLSVSVQKGEDRGDTSC